MIEKFTLSYATDELNIWAQKVLSDDGVSAATTTERRSIHTGTIMQLLQLDASVQLLGQQQSARDYQALQQREKLLKALLDPGISEPTSQAVATLLIDLEGLLTLDSETKLSGSSKERARWIISKLLDACDHICAANAGAALAASADYRKNSRSQRARNILRTLHEKQPDNQDVIFQLAEMINDKGQIKRAIKLYQKIITLDSHNISAHLYLANAFLELTDCQAAIHTLTEVKKHAPENSEINWLLKHAQQLKKKSDLATLKKEMPTLELSDRELSKQLFHPGTLAMASKFFRLYGTLCLTNIFGNKLISECRESFMSTYQDYLEDKSHEDALQIGHRRFQVTVSITDAFSSPEFYANPFVIQLMEVLIGKDVVLGSMVCATSLPGAKNQHLHKDQHALFARDVNDEPLDVPPVAITTMVPLVPLDENIGSTQVKKGSHRLARSPSAKLPTQTPIVSPGGCFFMDMALSHKGQGNQTDQVRPIINMVYHQHWFADNRNFRKQPPLRLSDAEYAKIPEQHRSLLSWTQQPGVDRSNH